jgi:hypothetical protein
MIDAHALMNRISEGVEPMIMGSMIPIYKDVEDGVDFDRTGILFRIGSEHFILTAAHHLSEYQAGEVWVYADVSPRTSAPIPLVRSTFYGTEVDDELPDRDIAAIHLDQDAVDQFSPHRRFLTLADCDSLIDPKPALYLVAGIPFDTYQIQPVATGKAAFYYGFIEPSPTLDNFHPHVHLALARSGYGLESAEDEFVPAEIPEFHGMSGCGIWRVASFDAIRHPDLWNPAMARLVAIQNRAQSNNHTVGTWFKHVIDRIVADVPGARSATELVHPAGY